MVRMLLLPAFFLNLGLMDPEGGCGSGRFLHIYWENGDTNLDPKVGVLTIGRNDTIRGHITTIWPMFLEGGYNIKPFQLSETIKKPIGVGFSASTDQQYNRPAHTSEWQLFLDTNSISPGAYTINIGKFSYTSNSPNLFLPGREFRLVVLAENTFSIDLLPMSLVQGTSRSQAVRIIRPAGFSDPVQLSLRPQTGFTATFTPNPFSGDSSIMQLTAALSVPSGNYKLVVDGTGGGFTGTDTLTVAVGPAQYQVVVAPTALSLSPGQNAATTVNVSGSTFLPATLSATSPDPNITFQFSPVSTSSTSTLMVTAGLNTPVGTYQIPIVGTFANGQTGIATLVVTISPSAGWTTIYTANSFPVNRVRFSDDRGIAVGNGTNIYRTSDRGLTWIESSPFGSGQEMLGLSLLGTRAVVAARFGGSFVSVDAGATWTGYPYIVTQNEMRNLAFSDVANGIAVGSHAIIRTTDGGVTWSAVPAIGDPYVFNGAAYRGGAATAVGFDGVIFRSTNHQNDWTQQTSGTSNRLNAVSFADQNNGIVVGDFGVVLTTTNGGTDWVPRNLPVTNYVDAYMLTPAIASICGTNTIHQTTDGGQTWTQDIQAIATFSIRGIYLFNDNSGIAVGRTGINSIFMRRE